MTTFISSNGSCPQARALANAAQSRGWRVAAADEVAPSQIRGDLAYWGGLDVTVPIAERFRLALIEPPLDLLARLPDDLLRRDVRFGPLSSLAELATPTFIKPADALDKAFDAGVYGHASEIALPAGIDPQFPVLLSEPVEWLCEFRCFVCERRTVAWSPYLSFGSTVWKPFAPGRSITELPTHLGMALYRLTSATIDLPPAFVVDIGLIEDRGWAVVEFNPVWGSNPLGADPAGVLDALARACRRRDRISDEDRRWVIDRAPDARRAGRFRYGSRDAVFEAASRSASRKTYVA